MDTHKSTINNQLHSHMRHGNGVKRNRAIYIYNNNNIIYYTVIVQTITGVYALSHGLFYTCHENCAAPMSIPCCPRLSCSDGNHGSKSLISTLFCNYSYDMDNGAEKYDRI